MPDTDAKDPIREQLIESRRAQIIDAAAKVFAEKGFHRATNKDIAEAAGVSTGTIYSYFDSKDDLLMGILLSFAELEDRQQMFDRGLEVGFQEFLLDLFGGRARRLTPMKDRLLALVPELFFDRELGRIYNEKLLEPAMAQIEGHLQARIELGQMRPIDVKTAARIFAGIFLGLIMFNLIGDPVVAHLWENPKETVEIMIDIFLNGVAVRGEE